MVQRSFETPGHVQLRIDNRAGEVIVRSRPGPTTDVEVGTADLPAELLELVRVDHQHLDGGDRVVVEVPDTAGGHLGGHRFRVLVPGLGDLLRSSFGTDDRARVVVHVPEGATLEVRTTVGDITADGSFGTARLETRSGNVAVGRIEGDLLLRSHSGDLNVQWVTGEARINSASGDVRCGAIAGGAVRTASGDVDVQSSSGALSVHTASGDVVAGQVSGGCELKSASGDQRVDRLVAGRAQLESVSGDMTVGIARASWVAVDAETVSGDLYSEIDLDADRPPPAWGTDGPKVDLKARSVSGDLRIVRASR
jgi:DUF4097 and DUF4098 domain-containing protein YvlB